MLRTIWASIGPEIKNVEAQKKFRRSYKKKCKDVKAEISLRLKKKLDVLIKKSVVTTRITPSFPS